MIIKRRPFADFILNLSHFDQIITFHFIHSWKNDVGRIFNTTLSLASKFMTEMLEKKANGEMVWQVDGVET